MGSFLQHREQRFRLSYVLGSWTEQSQTNESEFAFEEEEAEADFDDGETVGPEERARNTGRLRHYLQRIKKIAVDVESGLVARLGPLQNQKTADDRAAWLEIFDNEAFDHSEFAEVALDVLDDVAGRFSSVRKEPLSGGQRVGQYSGRLTTLFARIFSRRCDGSQTITIGNLVGS
jgi:hypothetical protein